MKPQYVGDIGDFGKLVLLKLLANGGFRIGVNWILTENDSRGDGKHRGYHGYKGRDCLCCCDRELYEEFRSLADKRKHERQIEDLERGIKTFCRGAVFYRRLYAGDRKRLNGEALAMLAPEVADLIFFDPDNGILSGSGTSEKHVYFEELSPYWKRGQSLLVYHHLSRQGTHSGQIAEIEGQFRAFFPGSKIWSFHLRRGTARVYFLCLQPHHLSKLDRERTESALCPLMMPKNAWAMQATCCSIHRTTTK